MNKYTLYIGLNDKDTKRQQLDNLEASKIVQNILTEKTGGGTIYNATGVYKHEDGTVIIENTLRVEIVAAALEAVREAITIIKTALNQESIILQCASIILFVIVASNGATQRMFRVELTAPAAVIADMMPQRPVDGLIVASSNLQVAEAAATPGAYLQLPSPTHNLRAHPARFRACSQSEWPYRASADSAHFHSFAGY